MPEPQSRASRARATASESFPSATSLVPGPCTVGLCQAPGTTAFNPPGAAIQVVTNVQYKLVLGTAPGITGTVTFYNGPNPITCTGGTDGVTFTANSLTAKCTTQYVKSGSKGITALYSGDGTYAPSATQKSQVVNPAPGATQDQIDIRTDSTQPCSAIWNPVTNPCGRIILHAPTSGRYSGLLFFQDRAIGFIGAAIPIWLAPSIGAAACDMTPVSTPLGIQAKFMVDGVPSAGPPYSTNPVPAPCGQMGGLSGTIYAAHTAGPGPGVTGDVDTVVDLRADGLANLQIIGAEIFFTQGNPIPHQARFAFDASLFANGKVRLVQ